MPSAEFLKVYVFIDAGNHLVARCGNRIRKRASLHINMRRNVSKKANHFGNQFGNACRMSVVEKPGDSAQSASDGHGIRPADDRMLHREEISHYLLDIRAGKPAPALRPSSFPIRTIPMPLAGMQQEQVTALKPECSSVLRFQDAAASADEQHMVVRQTTACVPAEHVFHRMPRWRIVFTWLYVGESYVCDLYAPSKVELVDGPI